MSLKYYELKTVIYVAQALSGLLLTIIGLVEFSNWDKTVLDLPCLLTGGICLLTGAGMLLFAFETYLLADDPDVWR